MTPNSNNYLQKNSSDSNDYENAKNSVTKLVKALARKMAKEDFERDLQVQGKRE